MCFLTGVLRGTAGEDDLVATLKPPCAPKHRMVFSNSHYFGDIETLSSVEVHPDGRVIMSHAQGVQKWVVLDGIFFVLGQAPPRPVPTVTLLPITKVITNQTVLARIPWYALPPPRYLPARHDRGKLEFDQEWHSKGPAAKFGQPAWIRRGHLCVLVGNLEGPPLATGFETFAKLSPTCRPPEVRSYLAVASSASPGSQLATFEVSFFLSFFSDSTLDVNSICRCILTALYGEARCRAWSDEHQFSYPLRCLL